MEFKKSYWLFGWGFLVVYILNMGLDIPDVDAAQYALISKEMLQSNNWLQVFCEGKNYLDKPPLLFWLTAFCFKILGVSNFSFRLPSLLVLGLGLYATFRLAKLFLTDEKAKLAALILASSFAVVTISNDVRTDTILFSFVIFSIWQLFEWILNKKKSAIWGSGIGIGLALLAKGPIGIFVPIFTVIPYLIYEKKQAQLFSLKWIYILLISLLCLVPMCVGLYQQFGIEGLKFFFWTQSFGRITGENSWSNSPDPFFLGHSTLWAFLPWTGCMLWAIWQEIKTIKNKENKSTLFFFGFVLSLLALSRSKYQLPHYIFVAFPLLAILTAKHLEENNFLKWTSYLISFSLLTFSFLVFYFFPSAFIYLLIPLFFTLVCVRFYTNFVLILLASMLSFSAIYSLHFQPELMKYQALSEVGKSLKEQKIEKKDFANVSSVCSFAFDFYAGFPAHFLFEVKQIDSVFQDSKEFYLLVNDWNFDKIKSSHYQNKFTILKEYKNYPVTKLKLDFLLPNKREQTLERLHFLKVNK